MRLAVRIPLLLASAVMGLGIAFALVVHVVVGNMTQHSARNEALQQLQVAQRALTLTGSLPPGAVLDDPNTPPALVAAARTGHTATWRDDQPPVIWAAQPASDGKVLAVQTSWQDWRQLGRDIDHGLTAAVAALAVLTALGSMLTGRRMGRRLGAAERVAGRISEGDRDARVSDVVGGHDEITSLARTIDQLSASMRERIEVEKRVTADIAHDLRTPLTGLVTAARLLDDDDPMAPVVRGQVDKLWHLTEDLLEVARLGHADQPLDVVTIRTSDLAHAAVETLPTGSASLIAVRGDGGLVDTDPRRAQRILVNLLTNALTHGRPPVLVDCTAHAITITDHGNGFPTELLATGPQRFRTASASRSTGHGLGLTIAVGQARVLDADLTFTNPPGGGAQARHNHPDRNTKTAKAIHAPHTLTPPHTL